MKDVLFDANDEATKDFSICIRVPTEEKSEFYEVCKKYSIAPSKAIRQMMKEYVKQYSSRINIL